MAILTACFDASGHESDQKYLVVAGFISAADQWIEFQDQWKNRLAEDGLTYFRMAECAQWSREFSKWNKDEPRRRKLLGDLMDIIKAHAHRKFGCIVVIKTFEKYVLTTHRENFLHNAYVLAGRACAGDVRRWLKTTGIPRFALVFEDGDVGKGKLRERLEEDGFPTPIHFFHKKDGIKDGIKKDIHYEGFTPLQASDWFAYELFKATSDESIDRWPLQEFYKIPGDEIGIYEPENLLSVNRMLDEIETTKKRKQEKIKQDGSI